MQLSERIQYLMKLNQLSASAFADEIDVQRSSISHVLSGRNKPSLEFIQKILKRFPKVDAAWLITGIPSHKDASDAENLNVIRSEDQPKYSQSLFDEDSKADKQGEPLEQQSNQSENTGKKLLKLIALYSDNSFEEFLQK